ncbi:alpha/beta fold hydrolase [Brevibacillus ginsengisoli]|uniref:alpha/beta fold hydrolase n=1 Tax=Brevibacillus ginsengisoli TaxID=363854 RepID=UPI003CECB95F
MKDHTIYTSTEGKSRVLAAYDSYLELLPADFERIHVSTRFGVTHTLVTGPKDAKPVFILQGGNCINPMTLSWFKSLFHDYRIYAPDTIGHPGYSDETRISAKNDHFALWLSDLMDAFSITKSAFIGPSYGAGIILRLATYLPDKIACSVLISPAGLALGSKASMLRMILFPLLLFKLNNSDRPLQKIADAMSLQTMQETDKMIIGEIFKSVRLERNMPKLTDKSELVNLSSPTMIIAGSKDIFFPSEKVVHKASETIPNLVKCLSYEMGHFPSEQRLLSINQEIRNFFQTYYE